MAERKCILIVDDEDALRIPLATALSNSYDVLQADSGKSGLEQALSHHPDLILLDYKMPDIDGIEVLKQLRADTWGKDAQIFFSTNTYDIEAVNAVMALGVKDYIIKSDIAIDALLDQVERHVG